MSLARSGVFTANPRGSTDPVVRAPKTTQNRSLATRPSTDSAEGAADRLAAAAMARPGIAAIAGRTGQTQRSARQVDLDASSMPVEAKGSGTPLPQTLRSDMEQRFGYDFADVTVHTDASANQSSKNLNAVAFSIGSDLFFAGGQYSPSTFAGRRLIAHELAHVVQRAAGDGPVAAVGLARQALESIDVTKLGDAALLQRAVRFSTWFSDNLIDAPGYDAELLLAEDVFKEMQARSGTPATTADLEGFRARLASRSPRSDFERKIRRGEAPEYKPVYDNGTVVGYRRSSGGYYEVRDVEGNFVTSGEKPLESPLIDPIDLIPFELLASLAVKAAAIGLRAAVRIGTRMLTKEGGKVVVEEGVKLGAKGVAGEAGGAATKQVTTAAAGDTARAATATGGEAAVKALVQVFRRGDKFAAVGAVSLKRLRNVLGRAGATPGEYSLVKVSKEAAASIEKEVGEAVWGWVQRDGAGALVRDARGRPIINFTPRALQSLEQAVKTFGHEAKHIKDFAAGLTTSSEALAEKAGEKLWLIVAESLAK